MEHWYIEPEVAGQLGVETEMDTSVHPPIVRRLHYQFDGWLGNELLEAFPCFIVTETLAKALAESPLTGWNVDDVLVTTSEVFDELHPRMTLPAFRRLVVTGDVDADFSIAGDHRLRVSDRALRLLRRFRIDHAVVEPAPTKSEA